MSHHQQIDAKVLKALADPSAQDEITAALTALEIVNEAVKFVPSDEILTACQFWAEVKASADKPVEPPPYRAPEPKLEPNGKEWPLRQFTVPITKTVVNQNGLIVFTGKRQNLMKLDEKVEIIYSNAGIKFSTVISSNGLRFGKNCRSCRTGFGAILDRIGRDRLRQGNYEFLFTEKSPGKLYLTVVGRNKEAVAKEKELRKHRNKVSSSRKLGLLQNNELKLKDSHD